MTEFERIAAGLMRNLLAEPKWALNKLDAAAVVGNFARETGDFKYCTELSPTVPGSRGGINLAQWTGPRRRDFEAYARRNQLDPCAWSTGYKFFFHETEGTWEKRWLAGIKKFQTLDQKTVAFEELYERAGVKAIEDRKARALRALYAYEKYPNADPIVPLPGGVTPGPVNPCPPCPPCPPVVLPTLASTVPPPPVEPIETEPFWSVGTVIGFGLATLIMAGGAAFWFFFV